MQAANPGLEFYPYHNNRTVFDDGVVKHILQRIYWQYPQCKAAFMHCRPVISIDATFLTGKYYGCLIIAIGVDAEDQLIPLAFALTEGENNDSWEWFLYIKGGNGSDTDRIVLFPLPFPYS